MKWQHLARLRGATIEKAALSLSTAANGDVHIVRENWHDFGPGAFVSISMLAVGEPISGPSLCAANITLLTRDLKRSPVCGTLSVCVFSVRLANGRTVRSWRVSRSGTTCLTFTSYPYPSAPVGLRTWQCYRASATKPQRRASIHTKLLATARNTPLRLARKRRRASGV